MSEHLDRMDVERAVAQRLKRERAVAERVLTDVASVGNAPPVTIANGATINAWFETLHDAESGGYDPAKCYLVTENGIVEFEP